MAPHAWNPAAPTVSNTAGATPSSPAEISVTEDSWLMGLQEDDQGMPRECQKLEKQLPNANATDTIPSLESRGRMTSIGEFTEKKSVPRDRS